MYTAETTQQRFRAVKESGGPKPAACSVPPDCDRDPIFYLEAADGAPLRPGTGSFRPHMVFKPFFFPPAFQPGAEP